MNGPCSMALSFIAGMGLLRFEYLDSLNVGDQGEEKQNGAVQDISKS